ncbi:myb-related transcription factor, partner of profilin-like [Astyanax mexicanus]|uniref:Myb-related transcription factor, partner of profilin-like n=1 Tax=Astyanax mexicanus TaxID=7994 RepID=A0A8B9JIM5_ASTMX|nr:myb-related transcription factor, partner of profilin-like [Astyanax mexicanus]
MSGYPYSYAGSGGGLVRFKKRKSRFTFPEVQLLLNEVKKNRHILVGKYNHGVSSDVKKRKWATLTARINEISDCHREIIEIIKKWSDLKCDTKRKVAAMRASGFSAAHIAQNLSTVETMVQQILQPSSADSDSLTADHVPDEDDEEDSQGAFGMPQHSPCLANGMPFLPPAPLPMAMMYSNDCAVPLTDFPFDPSATEDQSQLSEVGLKSDQSANFHKPFTTAREQVRAETQQQASNNIVVQAGTSSHATPSRPPPLPTSVGLGSLQDHLAKSASLSLKEQQAATLLIGTLSRSLESLSESVQQLVQTQQKFARDTLRLQRDTLHVLRDFSSTSLALLQDKANSQQ